MKPFRKAAMLTPVGQRSLLRELAANLSDAKIALMLRDVNVSILVDDEGPWAVIPREDTVRGGDDEMCLDWEDVEVLEQWEVES